MSEQPFKRRSRFWLTGQENCSVRHAASPVRRARGLRLNISPPSSPGWASPRADAHVGAGFDLTQTEGETFLCAVLEFWCFCWVVLHGTSQSRIASRCITSKWRFFFIFFIIWTFFNILQRQICICCCWFYGLGRSDGGSAKGNA